MITARAPDPELSPPRPTLAKHLRDLGGLIRIQLLGMRDTWIWMVLMTPVFALSILIFLRFFSGNPTPEQATYFITGSITYNLVTATTLAMGQTISHQKHRGHFEYYISLPIHKLSFILAVLVEGLVSAIPGSLIVGAAGMLLFDVPLRFSPALLPFLALAMAGMAGFGAFIGFWSPSVQVASYGTQLLSLLINFLSPVLLPITALPVPLQWIGRVLPSTYAAEGMRHLLTSGWTPAVTLDALYLAGFTLLTVGLVLWRVDWRGKA